MVDLESADGLIAEAQSAEVAAERLRRAAGDRLCLLAHHPTRGSVAALVPVAAEDAAEALRAAEALVLDAIAEAAPLAGDAPLISQATVRRTNR